MARITLKSLKKVFKLGRRSSSPASLASATISTSSASLASSSEAPSTPALSPSTSADGFPSPLSDSASFYRWSASSSTSLAASCASIDYEELDRREALRPKDESGIEALLASCLESAARAHRAVYQAEIVVVPAALPSSVSLIEELAVDDGAEVELAAPIEVELEAEVAIEPSAVTAAAESWTAGLQSLLDDIEEEDEIEEARLAVAVVQYKRELYAIAEEDEELITTPALSASSSSFAAVASTPAAPADGWAASLAGLLDEIDEEHDDDAFYYSTIPATTTTINAKLEAGSAAPLEIAVAAEDEDEDDVDAFSVESMRAAFAVPPASVILARRVRLSELADGFPPLLDVLAYYANVTPLGYCTPFGIPVIAEEEEG